MGEKFSVWAHTAKKLILKDVISFDKDTYLVVIMVKVLERGSFFNH
jgi:hypothetical protein